MYFIGQEEEFVPGTCFFRLVGEREDVWRKMSRPADYVARRCIYRAYGRHIAAVMGRSDWVFDNEPTDDPPDIDARLVDGLLCGMVIHDGHRSTRATTRDTPEDLRYMVRTPDAYFDLTYHRPVDDRCAYFVSQEVWIPPDDWQNHAMVYKQNLSWWRVYIEEYDAKEDDHYFQIFLDRQG